MNDTSEPKRVSFIKKGMKFKNKRFGDEVYVTGIRVENDVRIIEFQTGFEMENLPEIIFLKNYTRV